MRKLLQIAIIGAIAFFIQGCATHGNFVKKYNSWIGKDILLLTQQIGYPDSTYLLPNNNKVYVYEKSSIHSLPSMSIMGGYGYGGIRNNGFGIFGYGGDIVQNRCKLFIETNKKGTIVKWGSRGNSCLSNE